MSQIAETDLYNKIPGVKEATSSGGVVARLEDGQVWIAFTQESFNQDSFVLPKGHVEEGESFEEAAIREVTEETGITDLKLIDKLGIEARMSHEKDEWKTIHFFFFVTKQKEGVPTDPKHQPPAWFPIDSLPIIHWPGQRELIEENKDRIVKHLKNG